MSIINYSQLSSEPFNKLMALERAIATTSLDKHLFHLVKIRASQLNGCLFCLDMHVKEARRDGETELRLHHVQIWRESPLFSPQEKAALALTEKMTRLGEAGLEESLAEARQHFSDKEISDLAFVIGTINVWNRLSVTFRPTPGSMDKLLGLDKVVLNA